MRALLDTSQALEVCQAELGCEVEQLLTPASRFLRQKPHQEFSIDNGAFSGFRADAFLSLLGREHEAKHLCRFVAVPDVVGDARRTLESFHFWRYKLTGWPLAFVAQDGIEDLPIPWNQIQVIFIGGTTAFKLGEHAKAVMRCAQTMGKYIHVGRVNSPGRFEYFDNLGADSIDGQGLSQYTHMREKIWKAYNQPNLLTALAPNADEFSLQETFESRTAAIASVITAANGSGKDGSGCTDFAANLADQN